MTSTPLDSASWWVSASNVLYVTGAVLTVLTAAWVVYETRAVALGKHPKFFLLSEISGAIAAAICLAGTIGAIHFSNVVSHLKDVALVEYEKQADLKIADAQREAGTAKQNAGTANQNAAEANKKAAEANAGAQKALLDKTKILHDNLVLQQQIAQEQDARQQIQKQLAPRDLTQAQQMNIRLALQTHVTRFDQKRIDFVYAPNNSEIENLDIKISQCFDGTWTGYPFVPSWGMKSGIIIEFDPKNNSAAREADILVKALRDNGLPVSDPLGDLPYQLPEPLVARPDHRQSDAPLRVSIGPK